ncbi:MAG: permease [Firmicutes bacterium]|nr:permease [Bacillota bacterium]
MEHLLIPMGDIGICHLLLGFAGGVLGACFAALPAFAICGIFVLMGVALTFTGAGSLFLDNIAFGCIVGPQTAFAGGVAAAAYAASRKYLDTGRDVCTALSGLNKPDVLLVGGLFGSLGVALVWVFQTLLPFGWNGFHWTDSPGLTVFISAIIARLMFGKTGLLGKVPQGENRWQPSIENSWLPQMFSGFQILVIGLSFGFLSSCLALIVGFDNGGIVVGFGLSAVTLFLMQAGFNIPVTHHITLIAAGACAASGGSLLWGAIFGALAAFVGEYEGRLFLIFGDTHIDPPAMAIWSMWIVLVLSGSAGIFSAIPLP